MAKQLLIYERATPVNPRDHRDVSVKAGVGFSFAKDVNSVPLMAVEFDLASVEYPIVFVGDSAGVMPAALLGIRDNENLYVDEGGVGTPNICLLSCAAIPSCSPATTARVSRSASTISSKA